MVKQCQNEECGKTFAAARRDAKFCSERCRGQANARRARAAQAAATPSRVNDGRGLAEARLAAIEARLDGLERLAKVVQAETRQTITAATEEQGRARDGLRKSVRDLGGRLDGVEATVSQVKASQASARELRQLNERLAALEERVNEVVLVVNEQQSSIQRLDELLAELVEERETRRSRWR
jgi:chromosome segregation ATPase